MKKSFTLFLVLVILMVAAVIAVRFLSGEDNWICEKGEWVAHGRPSTSKPTTGCGVLVGNDRDEHGCIGSAGYSWCALKNKCLRVWEEKCL